MPMCASLLQFLLQNSESEELVRFEHHMSAVMDMSLCWSVGVNSKDNISSLLD